MNVIQIIQRMVQHIRLCLDKLYHLPLRLHSQHASLAEGINPLATNEGHLLQFDLVRVER